MKKGNEKHYINELSSFFDYSPSSIRYYEKVDIISPTKDERGCRILSQEDLYNLVDCKRYSGFGFTLKEISEIYNGTSEERFFSALKDKNQKLLKDIAIAKSIADNAQEIIDTYEMMSIRKNDIYVKKIPTQYYFSMPAPNSRIENVKELNKLLPVVKMKRVISSPYTSLDANAMEGRIFINEQDFHLINPPTGIDYKKIEEHYAFCKSVAIKSLDELALEVQECAKYPSSRGYSLPPFIYANSLIRIRIDDTDIRYTEIEVPINK